MLKKECTRLFQKIQDIGFEKTLQSEPYTKNELLAYIEQYIHICQSQRQKKMVKQLYLENQSVKTFSCDKIGVISDTHIGKDNMECLKRAYETFSQLGIYNVLHIGDFLDGCNHLQDQFHKKSQKKFGIRLCKSQIAMAIKNYPQGFETSVLMGNHDTLLRFLNLYLEDEISSNRPDIQFLGYAMAYIKLFEKSVLLKHPIPQQNLVTPSNHYQVDISLNGHSHQYMFDYITNKIRVPTCSTVFPTGKSTGLYRSGFLVLEQDGEKIYLNRYIFEGKKNTPQHCLKLELR